MKILNIQWVKTQTAQGCFNVFFIAVCWRSPARVGFCIWHIWLWFVWSGIIQYGIYMMLTLHQTWSYVTSWANEVTNYLWSHFMRNKNTDCLGLKKLLSGCPGQVDPSTMKWLFILTYLTKSLREQTKNSPVEAKFENYSVLVSSLSWSSRFFCSDCTSKNWWSIKSKLQHKTDHLISKKHGTYDETKVDGKIFSVF